MTSTTAPTQLPEQDQSADRVDDLAQIVNAYNEVTQRLQASHESLSNEVVRLQRELASTDAQLQRSKRLAALGEMAAGIAHEIRNPLAAMQLYLKMLQEDLPKQTPEAELVGKVIFAARGMEAIVTDVLHFSRELKPKACPVEMRSLVERVIEAHRPVAQSQQVTVEMDGDLDSILPIDPDLMHQALLNVVRNAVEAAPEQLGVVRIHVQDHDGLGTIRVEDNGDGVGDDEIDRIFNPFFTTRNTGTGLGLAIVHRIVDAHNGTITAHNKPDGGAVFEISIPHVESAGADE